MIIHEVRLHLILLSEFVGEADGKEFLALHFGFCSPVQKNGIIISRMEH